MNIIDTLLLALSPGLVEKRERSRLRATQLRKAEQTINAYEAGGIGRRFGGLKDRSSSANYEVGRSLPRMRNRHRALMRDNPWAAAAVRGIVTNTVGYGITGEVFTNGAKDQKLTDLWLQFAESTQCDANGTSNFYGLQANALESTCGAGEVLARRRWRRPEDRLVVPFQVELIEPDYLDHTRDQNLPNGGRIVQGVEFDAIGRRVAYWLFKDHPGDSLSRYLQSTRVDARDVAHMYRLDRPQQVRGVPWGHAAMLALHDLDGFEDAFLLRQKLSNCFMAVETDSDPMPQIENDQAAAEAADAADIDLEELEPGIIYRPKPGRQITWSNPPLAAEYGSYVDRVLYRVAAAYGISYQTLTGNLKDVNFSSGRMGWMDFQRNLDRWRWNMVIPQFCEKVAGWFLEAAVLTDAKVPADSRFEWTPPRREMIDPAKEIPPIISAIKSGITSLPAVHRAQGEHTARILSEISATADELQKLGLVLEGHPSKTSSPPNPPKE